MSRDKFNPENEAPPANSNKRVRRSSYETEDTDTFRRTSMPIIIILSIVTLVIIAVTMFISIKSRKTLADSETSTSMKRILTPSIDHENSLDENELKQKAERLNQVSDVLRAFRKASSADEVIPLITGGEYYRDEIENFLEIRNLSFIKIFEMDISEAGSKEYTSVNAYAGTAPLTLMVDNETALIDWESFAGTNSHSLAAALKQAQQDEGVVVRGFLSNLKENDYYNYDYSDREVWLSLNFVFPITYQLVNCYVAKESILYEELSNLFKNKKLGPETNKFLPIVIRLKAKDEKSAERKQLEIIELVSDSWLLPDNPKIAELNGGRANRDQSESE